MDKFRIRYHCHTEPDRNSELSGFYKNEKYIGRSYNGFFEVSPNWGGEHQTKLITKTTFNQYFKLQVPQDTVKNEVTPEILNTINPQVEPQNIPSNVKHA